MLDYLITPEWSCSIQRALPAFWMVTQSYFRPMGWCNPAWPMHDHEIHDHGAKSRSCGYFVNTSVVKINKWWCSDCDSLSFDIVFLQSPQMSLKHRSTLSRVNPLLWNAWLKMRILRLIFVGLAPKKSPASSTWPDWSSNPLGNTTEPKSLAKEAILITG